MDRSIIDGIIIINLISRKDRLEKCYEILEEIGMKKEDVFVLDATYIVGNGEIGCTHSHYRAVRHAIRMNWKNVLILEDDFKFEVSIDTFNSSLKQMVTSLEHWDVIMFEWGLNDIEHRTSSVDECHLLRKVTHEKRGAWRTVAYFVNSSIFEKLLKNFKISYKVQQKRRNIIFKDYLIDKYWQKLQHSNDWYICTPKLMVCRDVNDSNIR
jgi:GR25 family glycosyltransferase involved in LPS biosynthesis